MGGKSSEKKYNTRSQKKRRKEESSDDEDDESIWIEYSDDDEEDSDVEEEESDIEYKPKKNKKKRPKYESESSDEDSDEEEDEDGEDEDEDEDGEDGSIIDPRELRKTIATLFPSNYINEKIRSDEKNAKSKKKSIKITRSKNQKLVKNNKRRKRYETESSEESEYSDEESYYEDDDDDEEGDAKDFNILFSALTGGGQNPEEISDKNAIEDDRDEECNSDDEKLFMRENYETVPEPEVIKQKRLKIEKKQKKKKKHNTSEKSDHSETADAETEYKDLIELKKHLSEKLEKQPKNKILLNAVFTIL